MKETNWPEGAERVVSREQVGAAWDSLAAQLNQQLDQIQESELIIMPVMKGGLYPAVELTRRLRRPLLLDYVHATRYRNELRGQKIEWQYWPERDFSQATVVLVDDIFDEGYTLEAVQQRLLKFDCEVISVVLCRKQHDRGLARDWVDFHALEVPDRFVFGCGMDLYGHWRQLESIWALAEEDSS